MRASQATEVAITVVVRHTTGTRKKLTSYARQGDREADGEIKITHTQKEAKAKGGQGRGGGLMLHVHEGKARR